MSTEQLRRLRQSKNFTQANLLAVVVADLAGQHGLKQDDLDALRAPWADVFGDPLEVTA